MITVFKTFLNGKKDIYFKAYKRDITILADPFVSQCDNSKERYFHGLSPLHILAQHGVKEVLVHSDILKDEKELKFGDYILDSHWKESIRGKVTILHHLVYFNIIRISEIKYLFKYCPYSDNEKVSLEILDNLISTPNSVSYIVE